MGNGRIKVTLMHVRVTMVAAAKQYVFHILRAHHVTRHNTPIHNILSTAPQLSISQKALGTFPEDGNEKPKHEGATTHN
jgi:hypothetical protein